MRLIDANSLKLKKVYCQERHEWVVPVAEIDWTPTAYDVESVCEELERIRRIAFMTIANTGNDENDTMYSYVSKILNDAIDIVRRGGVDGNRMVK